jgi:hypothetical protein
MTEVHSEPAAQPTDSTVTPAAPLSKLGRWIASLSFSFWLFTIYWVSGQRGQGFPAFLGIDRIALALAGLGSLAICAFTCSTLVVQRAQAAKAPGPGVAAIAVAAAIGAAMVVFLGIWAFMLELGGPCG